MIKKILQYPQDKDILLQKSEEVKNIDEIKDLIQDMKDTLNSDPSGVGISAVQIGELKRVCVIKYDNKEYTLINPVITWKRSGANGIKPFKEGCLSAPGVYTIVNRPQKVVCEYLDENGETQKLDQGGWLSAIIQHELDHLEGFCEVFNAVDKQN